MYKVMMRDNLGWMKDDKLITGNDNNVIAFIKQYGGDITVSELQNADMIEICTLDGLKLSVVSN